MLLGVLSMLIHDWSFSLVPKDLTVPPSWHVRTVVTDRCEESALEERRLHVALLWFSSHALIPASGANSLFIPMKKEQIEVPLVLRESDESASIVPPAPVFGPCNDRAA